jgi:hypothetical protein
LFQSHPERLPARSKKDTMKIPGRAILLSLALLLLAGLAFWNRAFFITFFIEPIARILWLIYKTLLSVDQEIYWALLILFTLLLAIGMFSDHRKSNIRSAYQYSVQENDRVVCWETLLKSAERSESDRLVLQRNLETLQRSISAQSIRNDERGILMPPPKIGFQQRIQAAWKSFPLSKIGQRKRIHQATELEKSVDRILQLMEAQLEVHHD